jgi:hypothetical protein
LQYKVAETEVLSISQQTYDTGKVIKCVAQDEYIVWDSATQKEVTVKDYMIFGQVPKVLRFKVGDHIRLKLDKGFGYIQETLSDKLDYRISTQIGKLEEVRTYLCVEEDILSTYVKLPCENCL